MAKRLSNNVITGSDKKLGLYFYYSPYFGHNIIRRTTSLSSKRVKTDNAFRGFRESGNRMKQASPIAAALYKMIPSEIKQYSIYRLLTGEVLKMLKTGLENETILKHLKKIHIEPLLNGTDKDGDHCEEILVEQDRRQPGLKGLIIYPELNSRSTSRIRRRRGHQFSVQSSQVITSDNHAEFSNIQGSNSSQTEKILPKEIKHKDLSAKRVEKIPGLIYLGRLPQCKKLKMWVRSDGFPGASQ